VSGAVLEVVHSWYCPNCGKRDQTKEARPHTRFHTCPAMALMAAPMIPAGTKCKVEAHLREDYVGRDLVQTDANGRPVMSIVTTRDDGQDCVVFAPTAIASVKEQ
jgi:hypothetical protein